MQYAKFTNNRGRSIRNCRALSVHLCRSRASGDVPRVWKSTCSDLHCKIIVGAFTYLCGNSVLHFVVLAFFSVKRFCSKVTYSCWLCSFFLYPREAIALNMNQHRCTCALRPSVAQGLHAATFANNLRRRNNAMFNSFDLLCSRYSEAELIGIQGVCNNYLLHMIGLLKINSFS